MSTNSAGYVLPSGIKSYEASVAAAKAPKASSSSSGASQSDFLKLFTTQLQNQNPLDPTKNEAFVAQLAQFSQLEATTNMATQLTSFVSSMSGERMMSGAALIGKKIAVADGVAMLTGGQPVTASIALPTGADGVQMDVLDNKGALVKREVLGPQVAGNISWTWNGGDSTGRYAPDGNYTFKATAVSQGKTVSPVVSTYSTVTSVNQSGTDNTLLLEVSGGKTVNFADVQRIGS